MLAAEHWQRWSVSVHEATEGPPLCLSLCNTRHWRNSASPHEMLNGYGDIVKWAIVKRIVTDVEGVALEREASAHPRAANAEVARTIMLREAVAGIFASRAHNRIEPAEDLAILIETFNEAAERMKLALVQGRLVPSLPASGLDLQRPRWQTAFSAIGLLTSEAIVRVKQCADDRGCGWLFLDTTRNASRRFCFSRECGNRARQAKLRERRRTDAHPH